MFLLSPLWLLGLLPWLGVTIWMLWGRHRGTLVPFVALWRGPVPVRRARRSMERPPLGVALALLAVLLSLCAAARPGVRWRTGTRSNLALIVDRGLTMSAGGENGLGIRGTWR